MEGYTKVATLMGRHTELSSVRAFRTLAFQDILFLQAQLVHLENELKTLAAVDRMSTHPRRALYEKSWNMLNHSQEDGNDEQWQKCLEIRHTLECYYTSIERYTSLSKATAPSRVNLEFLRDWFQRKTMGACPLLDEDKHAWDTAYERDLISLSTQQGSDFLSGWFNSSFIRGFHSVLGKRYKSAIEWDPESGLVEYSEVRTKRVLNAFVSTVSSLLPVASIVALYSVTKPSVRLGMVAAFTGLFSFVLGIMTEARGVENFAATSAFAAIQVVFISSNGVRQTY